MANKNQTKKSDKGFGSRIRKFFRDTASEFKKIVWPARKAVINNIVVVLTTVVIFAVVIWALDYGFSALRQLMIDKLSTSGV